MAVTREVTSNIVSEEDRTWRATLETPVSGDYSITVHRHTVSRDAQGNAVGEPVRAADVTRAAEAILSETVTITLPNGNQATVSALAVMLALPEFFDKWAKEDATTAE